MKAPTIGNLESGKALALDVGALASGRLLISAQSGAGKSWALRRLLEQTYGLVPQIVIDREGEFYTLRENFDYLLAGGDDGDCQADVRSASLLARRILELRLSAIIDIEPLAGPDRYEFVNRFIGALIDAPKQMRSGGALVVLDEAHQFAPQTGKVASRDKVIQLASIGRKRGLVACFATQRLAKLNKDVAAECANRLIGRTTLQNDAKQAMQELGLSGAEGRDALRKLSDGEFFAYGPALSREVLAVKVGSVQTTHPQPGSPTPPTPPPRAEVRRVLAELADLPKRAVEEARTIEDARKEIRTLKGQLSRRAPVVDEKAIEHAVADRDRHWQSQVKALQKRVELAGGRLTEIGALCQVNGELSPDIEQPKPVEARRTSRATSQRAAVPRASVSSGGLEQRILDAIAWWNAAGVEHPTRTQVSFVAKAKGRGGYFRDTVSRMRTGGLVEYPQAGSIALTEAGRERAGAVAAAVPTFEDLCGVARSQLSGLQVRILDALIAAGPMTRSELSERVAASGGYFRDTVGRLKSLGIVQYPATGEVDLGEMFMAMASDTTQPGSQR